MRSPSNALVVDASILIAAVRGRTAKAILELGKVRQFIATERTFVEAERRIVLGLKRPDLIPTLAFLKTQITVIGEGIFIEAMAEAARCLRLAVASANGSVRDSHILALAWAADADIWSTDRDFAGTGVASWSTPNLVRALAETDS